MDSYPSPVLLKRSISKKLSGLKKKKSSEVSKFAASGDSDSLWNEGTHDHSAVDGIEEDALDQLIVDKLHSQLGIPITGQSAELLKPYTKEQKVSIYAEIGENHCKVFEEASYYIEALSHPHSLKTEILRNLTLQLKFGTRTYITEFEELLGIQKIVEALRWCEYKCSSLWYYQREEEQQRKIIVTEGDSNDSFPGIKMNTIPNKLKTDVEFNKVVKILCHLVRSIIAVLHHPLVCTLQAFVSIPDGIPLCIRLLEWCPLSLQGDVFLLIAGGIALQRKHQQKLSESLKRVPLYHQPFFPSIIYPELCYGTDVHYKVAYLTFVNTLISFQEIAEERPLICRKYISCTLLDSLENFAVVYPDDAFCSQLELIQQEMEGFENFSEYQLSSSTSSTPRGGSSITPRGAAITPRIQNNRESPTTPKSRTISINELTSNDLDHQSAVESQLEKPKTPRKETRVTIREPQESETKVPKLSLRSLSKRNIDEHFITKEPDAISDTIPAPPPMAPPPLKLSQSRYIPFKIKPLPEIQQKSSIFADFQLQHAQSLIRKEDVLPYFLRSDIPKSSRVKKVKEEEPEDWKSELIKERTEQGLFNVNVILRGFATQENTVSTTDIFHYLSSCVPDDITSDTIGKLLSIFPYDRQTRKPKFIHEETAYRALTQSQVSELNHSQRFLYDLYLLGNPLDRLFCLQAQLALVDYIPLIDSHLKVVMTCMKSITLNSELHKFIQAVVLTSSYLTEQPIPATSMDLSALGRLKHIKTADRSKTLLHVLLESIQRNHAYILRFPEQFTHLEEANRVFPMVAEYALVCKKELAVLKENIEFLQLKGLQRVHQRLQQEYDIIYEKLEGIYKDMEFIGYTQARSAPCEFFPFWIEFLSTFNLSLKWLDDNKILRVRRKRRDAQRHRDSIIHSIVLGNDENPFSDLQTPSFRAGVFDLVDSPKLHLDLRNSSSSKKIRRRKQKRNKRAYQTYTKLET